MQNKSGPIATFEIVNSSVVFCALEVAEKRQCSAGQSKKTGGDSDVAGEKLPLYLVKIYDALRCKKRIKIGFDL